MHAFQYSNVLPAISHFTPLSLPAITKGGVRKISARKILAAATATTRWLAAATNPLPLPQTVSINNQSRTIRNNTCVDSNTPSFHSSLVRSPLFLILLVVIFLLGAKQGN